MTAQAAQAARDLIATARDAASTEEEVRAGAQALASPLRSLSAAWDRAGSVLEALAPGSVPASPTPINPRIGPHRRFDWLRLNLDDAKAVKRALGGTVNDVVLATVVGAARRFLLARGVQVEGLDFRALVPVSIRAAEQEGMGPDARLVFITHDAKESAVQATVQRLRELTCVRSVNGLLRVIAE